jgi:transposase-like protein
MAQTTGRKKRQYTDKDKAAALVALEANGGNAVKTARDLGIPRQTLLHWNSGAHVSTDVPIIGQEKRRGVLEQLVDEQHAILALLPSKRGDASYQQLMTALAISIDKSQLLQGADTAIVSVRMYETVSPDDWDTDGGDDAGDE